MQQPFKIKSGDFLAGGGGVTYAMTRIPDLDCRWVLNHDPIAIKTNMYNNKGIKHFWADFYKQDEHEMELVDFVWASIECTQHSRANGKKKKKLGSYTLGWELKRYIKYLNPYMIGIENVPEFKDWAPVDKKGNPIKSKKGQEFKKWKQAIMDMGYEYDERIFNAADHGLPTRRVRFFCFFYKKELGMTIPWAPITHNKFGTKGLKKWVACKSYIDLQKEGNSIFGRKFNPNVAKGKRNPLCPNTLKRIAGGIKKFNPEMYMIMQYYGSGINAQSINSPLNTCTVKDRHVLIKMEKLHFIQDYCQGADIYDNINGPMSPQLTWQTKHFITLEKKFMSVQNNSNGNPDANNFSIDEPCWATTVTEKFQFISSYFNSSNGPETQNQDLESPLNAVLTATNKKSLITAIKEGKLDFDIKMRFLDPEEIARITTFPEGYFTHPELKLSKKAATKLIGNAVPPEWARIIIQPVVKELTKVLSARK